MRLILTGHKGYIGAVAGPLLQAAGHDVVGLDTDLFAGCDFGNPNPNLPELRKDLRDLSESDFKGFDAVVHLGALSNDPLGNLDPKLTYDINHRASVRTTEVVSCRSIRCVGPLDLRAQAQDACVLRSETPKHRARDWARRPITPKQATRPR